MVYPVFLIVRGGEQYMKFQWTWLVGIVFALIIAVFSVMNVDAVPVNYVFGTAEWPLVLVIIGAALLGAAVSGTVALIRSYKLNGDIKELKKKIVEQEQQINTKEEELISLRKMKLKKPKKTTDTSTTE